MVSSNTGASVGMGAASGAAAGAMLAPGTMGLSIPIGALIGAAGGLASGMAGDKEAKRKDNAIKAYRARAAALYDQMAKDSWAQGTERQAATGATLEGLQSTMGATGAAAPQVADYLPAAADGQAQNDYMGFMERAGAGRGNLEQANTNAVQAGMNRGNLSQALNALVYSSTINGQVKAPEHARYQWMRQQELEQAQAELESIMGTTGNASRNLALLGQGIQTAGQLAMIYGASTGGPTANNFDNVGRGGAPVYSNGNVTTTGGVGAFYR